MAKKSTARRKRRTRRELDPVEEIRKRYGREFADRHFSATIRDMFDALRGAGALPVKPNAKPKS